MSVGPVIGYRVLVVAKAPVRGRVKTRLGASVGDLAAARLAAAALLDTVVAATAAVGAERCVIAIEGDLGDGELSASLLRALTGWRIVPQRGDTLGERIAAAHEDSGSGPIVQIGMDTPQVTADDLDSLAASLQGAPATLAPAADGGWWALAVRDPRLAVAVREVPMSRPTTYQDTLQALAATGMAVQEAHGLVDVDTAGDARQVAAEHPRLHFSRMWAGGGGHGSSS